eukprot:gene4823-8409_t
MLNNFKRNYSLYLQQGLKYHEKQNYKEAINSFIKSKEPTAFKFIGEIYLNELNNPKESFKYFKIATEMGDIDSLAIVGHFYEEGIIPGLKKNLLKSIQYYKNGVEKNNTKSMIYLGIMYEIGNKIIQKNENLSKKYYLNASKLGDRNGFYHLGLFYLKKKDYKKAINYFEKGLKNESKDVDNVDNVDVDDISGECLYNLGLIYKNGIGVEKDVIKAFNYFQKSSSHGNSKSMILLGQLFKNGSSFIEKNFKKSMNYFEKSIEFKNWEGYFEIGNLYFDGILCDQNIELALIYFKKGEEKNESNCLNSIGYFYENGIIFEKSIDKAIEYYERSSILKNAFSFFNLGLIYMDEYENKLDLKKSYDYFLKSADLGYAKAMTFIGEFYRFGKVVEQSFEIASSCYQRAIDIGDDPSAMINLGLLYLNGNGVNQNVETAKELFNSAFENGFFENEKDYKNFLKDCEL